MNALSSWIRVNGSQVSRSEFIDVGGVRLYRKVATKVKRGPFINLWEAKILNPNTLTYEPFHPVEASGRVGIRFYKLTDVKKAFDTYAPAVDTTQTA